MNYPKRLIEVDLPIKLISEHARREKSSGSISMLHTWWARRPLGACRAVICAALWPDPADESCPLAFRVAVASILCKFAEKVRTDHILAGLCSRHWKDWQLVTSSTFKPEDWQSGPAMRYHLLNFIADFANREASTNPVFLETAHSLTQTAYESLGGTPGTRPLVVDPFAGGGTIPLEALRVGADAFASDLNPVAVLLNRVVLEFIPRYGQELAKEVRKWGNWIKEQAEQELAEFYPKDADGATPMVYFWARTIICEGPGCGVEVPLMRSFWLAKRSSKSLALHIVPNPEKNRADFEIIENPKVSDVGQGTIRRGSAECPICGYTTPVASVRRQLKEHHGGAKDARLFAVVTTRNSEQGRFYHLPTHKDIEAVQRAEVELQRRKIEYHGMLSLVPDECLPPQGTLGFRVQLYGMEQWSDLFSSRQLLALTTLVRLVQEVQTKLTDKYERDFVGAVQTCLALMIDRCADYWSSLCSWHTTGEKVNHTFTRQAISMVWDFVEVNPFSDASSLSERTLFAKIFPTGRSL